MYKFCLIVIIIHLSLMKTRQKDIEKVSSDSGHFRQCIKASQSEITKDFFQINNSVPVFRKMSQQDLEIKKLQKVKAK